MKNKQVIQELKVIQSNCSKVNKKLKDNSNKEKDTQKDVDQFVGMKKENNDKLQAFFDRFDPKFKGLEKKEQIKKLNNQKQIVKD